MKNVKYKQVDLDELADFLMSDATPEECMDISTMDGFLTNLVIGPVLVQPSQWLPVLFGSTENDEMEWESIDQFQRISGLIFEHFNRIAEIFKRNPKDFSPVFYENPSIKVRIIADWCYGFMQGIALSGDSWLPLIQDDTKSKFLSTVTLFGTDTGWKELEENPKLKELSHDDWANLLHESVLQIHEFWLPYRGMVQSPGSSTHEKKIQRNDPCPCGSGKKFKKCCWLKMH